MAYRVTGIRDSEKEGWFKSNPENRICTSRTEVDTPLGTIIVDVSNDSDYPGVWLSFRENNETYERTVALFEAESPESVALKVWEDERINEDYTKYFSVAKKMEEKIL